MDRLFRFFAIAECRIHDASSLQVHSQATVSCSQPEYSGLLMFCQTVDWVCRGVVVSSDPSSLVSLTVSEQGFGFLVSGGGQGLQLFAPRLARRSALSFPTRLDGLVVKASASRAEDPGFDSRLRRDFSGSCHTSDLKIGTPVATLPDAWHCRVSTGTGRPGVSIL